MVFCYFFCVGVQHITYPRAHVLEILARGSEWLGHL